MNNMNVVPVGHSESWQSRVSLIDEQINALKQQRNREVPIGRLPSELLALIFLCHQGGRGQEHDYPRLTEAYYYAKTHAWAGLMLVCRAFREAALSCTSLWSFIDLRHPNHLWVDLCIERSQGCLLDVRGLAKTKDHAGHATTHDIEQLMPRAMHLRLHIEASSRESWARVQEICADILAGKIRLCELKFLVVFNIHVILGKVAMSNPSSDTRPRLPSLRYLVADYFENDWLAGCSETPLWHTPNLTFLRLSNVFSGTVDHNHNAQPTLEHLSKQPRLPPPHLERMQLTGMPLSVAHILSVIPDPRFELVVEMNENMYSNSLITSYVQNRVWDFLSNSQCGGIMPDYETQIRRAGYGSNFALCVRMHSSQEWARVLQLEIVCSPEDYHVQILHHAAFLEVESAGKYLQAFSTVLSRKSQPYQRVHLGITDLALHFSLAGTAQLEDHELELLCKDLVYGPLPETALGDDERVFRRILTDRTANGCLPVILTLNWLTHRSWDDGLPHMEERSIMESAWKAAGWVETVKWTLRGEPLQQFANE